MNRVEGEGDRAGLTGTGQTGTGAGLYTERGRRA